MKNYALRTPSRLLLAMLSLLLLLALPAALIAQGTSATVTGFVTDVSGAKVPAATVTFTNVETGVVGTTTTNGVGLYRITGLLPGSYRSTVAKQGFKTEIREGIALHLEDQVSIDYSLEVGVISESVTVSSAATLLESQTPTVSQVIEGRQVEDTPLNGRNPMNLIALTPGVVPQGSTSGSISNNTAGGSFTNALAYGNYQISGGLANEGSVYLDGAPVNVIVGHTLVFIPAQDTVQEFRVESSVVSPQYGEFGGGVLSFVTKSGTNHLHGTVYEYLRNTDLNANNFFLKGVNQPRPEYIQNQYGATVGGPIKKGKAFFFMSYEGFRQAQGVPNLGRVPTAAELSGNFTADPKIINPVPVLGPMVAPGVYAYAMYKQASCEGVLNTFCLPGQPSLPGDAIADPTATYMANTLHYFPLPNTTNAGPAYNYSQTGKANAYNNTYDLRGDWSLGTKQKLFAKYGRLDRTQQATKFIFNNPNGPNSGANVGASVSQYVFGDDIVVNSTSVISLRASYLRFFSYLLPANNSVNLAGFGAFWGGIANQVPAQTFPNISITGNITQPFAYLSNNARQPVNQYVFSGTYTKVLGRHSLSLGGESRRRESYVNNIPDPTGLLVFAGTNTACVPSSTAGPVTFNDTAYVVAAKYCGPVGGPPVNLVVPGSGETPIADFMAGQFAAAPLGIPTTIAPSAVSLYGGLFANDTFQVTEHLTLTAGLRYELPGGFTEKHNNNAVILPQLANPLVLVNTSAYPSRSDLESHLSLFSPRLGISYQPHNGTVVRTGYSLAFLPMDLVFYAGPIGSSVNNPTTFVPPSYQLSAPLGYVAGTTTPKTTLLAPIGKNYANNPTYFYGQSIQGRNPYYKFPYLQQWNFNVQQTFGSSTVVQLAYLGATGVHLPIAATMNINQLPDADFTAPTSTWQSLRPYPNYQNVNVASPWVGSTNYNSLQATLTKRFQSGGTFLANYSWSKFLGNADSQTPQVETHTGGVIQDFTNLRAEKSYLSFDVPQRLVLSYILDLPVGKGKHFLAKSNGVVENIVSGWNASGISTFQSGFPLAIITTTNVIAAAYGGGTIRPNVVAGCAKAIKINFATAAQQQKPLLNSACWTSPTGVNGAYFGNQPRTDGSIRSQGIDNWDLSVGKTTAIRDNVTLVFRAEAFNIANRVQFGDPGLSSAATSFGIVTTQSNQPRSFQFSLRANY